VRREVSLEQLQRGVEQSHSRFAALAAVGQDSPSSSLRRREKQAELALALAALPPDYQKVIQLRHMEGLGFDDIATCMRRSSGAVRMLWLRAIKQLRTQMDMGEGHEVHSV
jgi:RNA polymerase sigma-70 factor (ECF subfamily)